MALQNGDDFVPVSTPETIPIEDELFDKLFFVDGVLDTLKSPLLISVFPQECADDLIRMKEKADENVLAGIKQILGLDISDITKVKSVFETPRFFNDVLESCELELSREPTDNISDNFCERKEDNKDTDRQTDSCETSLGIPNCSVQLGHKNLDKVACENESFLDHDNEIASITRHEENKFSPIDPASVTPSVFKLTDIRKYLFQSKFCQSCLKNKKNVFRVDEEIDTYKGNKALSRSYLKLNKISLVSKQDPSKSLTIERNNSPNLILSPDISECSNDSGMFQVYKTDKQSACASDINSNEYDSHLALKSPEEERQEPALSVQTSQEERQEPALAVQISQEERQEPDLAVQISQEERQESVFVVQISKEANVIQDLKNNKEETIDDSIEDLATEIHTSKDKEAARRVFFSDKKQFKDILKTDKKKSKKLKKRKYKNKASIHLSPPPGVDIDEYLQQQLLLIKAQLKSQCDVEKDLNDKNNVTYNKISKESFNESNISDNRIDKNNESEERLKNRSPISISSIESTLGSKSFQLPQKIPIDGRFRRVSDALSSNKSTSGSPTSILMSPDQKICSGSSRSMSVSDSPKLKCVSGSPKRSSIDSPPRQGSGLDSPRWRSIAGTPRRKSVSGSPRRRSVSGSPIQRSVSRSPRHKLVSRSPRRSVLPRKRSPRKSFRDKRRTPSPRYYHSRSRFQSQDYKRQRRSRSPSPRKFRSPYGTYDRNRLALRAKRSRSRSPRRGSSNKISTSQRYIRSPVRSQISYKSKIIEVERTTSRYRYINRSPRSRSPKDRKNKNRSSSPLKHGALERRSSGIETVAISTTIKEYERLDEEISLSSFSSTEGQIFQVPFSDYYMTHQPALEMTQSSNHDLVAANQDPYQNYYINSQPVMDMSQSVNQGTAVVDGYPS